MKKNPYKEAPASFSICLHTDCTCASNCLRQLAYPILLERETFLHGAPKTLHARTTAMPLR